MYPLLFALLVVPTLSIEWTSANYPNPYTSTGSEVCNRPAKSFICDPDNIISPDSANVVSLSCARVSYKRHHLLYF